MHSHRRKSLIRRGAPALLSAAALVTGGLVFASQSSAFATTHTATHTATPAASSAHTHRLCSEPSKPGYMACQSVVRTDIPSQQSLGRHDTPKGFGPSDLQAAYNLPKDGGKDATVAIVDANDDPNAEKDLAAYRKQYGLPECSTSNGCFKKIDQDGGAKYPAPDAGWAGEISLDVDMVSAACPSCHILLVEAKTANMDDLGAAVNQAVKQGAKYVSNSYGGGEEAADTSADDKYFKHPGVAITVSSGDSGYGVEYPAASQYVTAVGGTSLKKDSSKRGYSESVWGTSAGGEGAGSGCSKYDAKPSWQKDSDCAKRTVADVAAVADPATGLAVYDTYQAKGWNVYGGTSASSPFIAGVYALAGAPGSGDVPASYPYAHADKLNDVTEGSNGSCGNYQCQAGKGYDGPTGLGTPNGAAAFTK
ncbi:S53 family peptidase [Streptomyces natalensis]|uniref:S53 family peptidase n=1 Tax=Streptomyces natalensis TaxID=68242 RepID=UPI0004AA0871|nr:S53 family peptidase [Streptomyces natalensis]